MSVTKAQRRSKEVQMPSLTKQPSPYVSSLLAPPCPASPARHPGQGCYPVIHAVGCWVERKAQWLTEIRPLIRGSDWGLWRGLSFLADRDVSRVPNPFTIRHTSAISDQFGVPATRRRCAARCLSMSFIVPFSSLAQPSATPPDGLGRYW